MSRPMISDSGGQGVRSGAYPVTNLVAYTTIVDQRFFFGACINCQFRRVIESTVNDAGGTPEKRARFHRHARRQ